MAQLPVPKKAKFISNMTYFGDRYGLAYTNGTYTTDDQKLTAQYYDSAWVFLQIYDYQKSIGITESKWNGYADQGNSAYRTYGYALGPIWNTQGYRNFPHGLFELWLRTGDVSHKTDLVQLSQNAAYCPDATPLVATSVANGTPGWDGGSREAAYELMSYILAQSVGEPVRAKRDGLIDQVLDHFNQWVVTKTADYVRPFMMALSSQALLTVHEKLPTHIRVTDKSIINMMLTAWEWAWANCWLPANQAFMYTDRNVATGGQEAAPDLNMLIAPVFAWLYHQTGDVKWQQRGDQIFQGGVMEWVIEGGQEFYNSGAYLFEAKQYNQNYRWSLRYLEWREADPLTVSGGGDPIDPPPPPPPGGGTGGGTHGTTAISHLYNTAQSSIYIAVGSDTWATKFQSNGWTTIQQQIDAGYLLWIQPTALTSEFEEVVDLGAIVTLPTLVTFSYNPVTIDGSVAITPILSTSLDAITWTDYSGVTQVLASNFQYLKINLTSVATNKRGLVRIDELRFKLSLKEKRDGGSGTVTVAATGKVVTFNKTFLDLDEIIVTAAYTGGASELIAVYSFVDVPNPTSFTVYLINQSNGAKATGSFSWSVKGV